MAQVIITRILGSDPASRPVKNNGLAGEGANSDRHYIATRARTVGDWEPRDLERFWARIDCTGPCWLWTAGKSGGRRVGQYGVIRIKRQTFYAHRVMWELTYGAIPPGLNVLHKCDTPACCCPAHLFLGTQSDNLLDASAKGRLGKRRAA